ncbi:hypothetical protein Y032_0011g1261 [Ancylostoma ceylanicum]|uniref:Uncharacterized protein n=1 Tax=Ancylostoma ceylanicum TaxID=53326 RepID=A0A016VDU0_9BILA|nr:hypothetical protein Y032_0011g1261 [Ancylostoma ceylanicum]
MVRLNQSFSGTFPGLPVIKHREGRNTLPGIPGRMNAAWPVSFVGLPGIVLPACPVKRSVQCGNPPMGESCTIKLFRLNMSTSTVNNDTFIVLLGFTFALRSTPFFNASLVHILEKTSFFSKNLRKGFIVLSGVLDSFCLS